LLRPKLLVQDPDAFFKGNWEQKPAVFKATPERVALFQGLCSFPSVLNWLKQREKKAGPLAFGVDVNAARYKNGVRETPNGEVRSFSLQCRLPCHAAAPDGSRGYARQALVLLDNCC
jgi:hypothetical protein